MHRLRASLHQVDFVRPGERLVMREQERLRFWSHHVLTSAVAVLVLTISRLVGYWAEQADVSNLLLHSVILVVVAHPIQTAGGYLSMRFAPAQMPLYVRAIMGCVAASPVVALITPQVSWALNAGPAAVLAATTYEDLIAVMKQRYVYVVAGFGMLGTAFWMIGNYSWWREEIARRTVLEGAAPVEPEQGGEAATPLFLKRLPPEKRGELWALSSELHYVRVYTSKGNDLVMMRLSDAIDLCAALEGLQIHRSHWVARDGIESIEGKNGHLRVRLKNGNELPVSRSRNLVVRKEFPNLIGS
ncbi:MAG: LytTR family DNA-binding domain-containing protein [Hyphomonadaceae bacterium]